MPEKEGAEEKKTTKEVVNKKQKQILNQEDYIPEEGYDIARDEGRVSPAKDKKDATTAPRKGMTPKERKKAMQQAQQKSQMAVNNVVTALRKKYGKDAVMYTQKTSKAKSNEELDLTQVAEAFGGHVIDENVLDDIKKIGGRISSAIRTGIKGKKRTGKETRAQIKKDDPSARFTPRSTKGGREAAGGDVFGRNPTGDATVDIEQRREGPGRRKVIKQIPQDQVGVAPGQKEPPVKRFKSQGQLDAFNRAKKFRQTDAGAKGRRILQNRRPAANVTNTKKVTTNIVQDIKKGVKGAASATVKGIKDAELAAVKKTGTSFKKLRSTAAATKIGTASKGLESVGKVGRNLTKGTLKYGKGVGTRLLGKGGAFGAKTLGKAGAKFGAKRIYGVGSAIAGAEAIGRFAKGDIVGGTLAGAEAITGLIPGLGTAVSTGLGALGLARDVKRTKQAVGAIRKIKNVRKLKPVTKGLVGSGSLTKKTFGGFTRAVKKNPVATAVGGTGTAIVGTNVADQRSRRRLRLPNLPAPSLTGGSAGFRTAG